MADQIIYRDFKKTFAAHPVKRDVMVNNNEEAVKDSIINLIFTAPYERYRQPRLGAGIPSELFENLSPTTEYEVQKRIEETIQNNERRAILEGVVVKANYDQNNYSVTIVFRTINSFQPVTISQILRRVR